VLLFSIRTIVYVVWFTNIKKTMKVVLQRVLEASVEIDLNTVGAIKRGLLVFLGVDSLDGEEDIEWISKKILQMRIFNDNNGVMNLSVMDIKGEILVVSQFTLMARTKKGNRPSYIDAALPEISIPIYERFVKFLTKESGLNICTGQFGADMKVRLLNDGPVTIIIDSKNRV
jgi:D-tyrosyl-tRNA(Tyr) deacylase